MIRIARPGPGNGCRQTIRSGIPSSSPTRRTSSLKSSRSGSTSSISHVGRQTADVVVALDRLRDAVGAAGLDHVGVQRPLDEPADVAEPPRLLLEHADELLADPAPLLLGLGDARQPCEEALLRLHVDERDAEVPAEGLDDLRGLVLAEEAVVDEHAGQLIADRPVHEQRRDGAVDSAREPAEHAFAADTVADALHLLLDHGGRRPGGRYAGDVVEEVLEHLLPVRRVHDLGVELDAVAAPRDVLEGGDRRRAGTGDDTARRPGRRRPSRGATSRRSGRRAGRGTARPRATSSSVLPNSPAPVRSTRPPSSWAISCIP